MKLFSANPALIKTLPTALGFFLFAFSGNADAYIGPGAGFALVSSFLVLFIAVCLAIFTICSWPIRSVILYLKRRKLKYRHKVKRVVIIGFDGLDPDLCSTYIKQGQLTHLSKLCRVAHVRLEQTRVARPRQDLVDPASGHDVSRQKQGDGSRAALAARHDDLQAFPTCWRCHRRPA